MAIKTLSSGYVGWEWGWLNLVRIPCAANQLSLVGTNHC